MPAVRRRRTPEADRADERADGPTTRSAGPVDAVVALQASAGNHAVAQMLARKERDPAKMSETEIDAELEANFTQREAPGVSRAKWQKMFDRGMKLHEELDRRAKAEESRERIAAARGLAKDRVAHAAEVGKRFGEELTWVDETLTSVTDRLGTYMKYYEEGHGAFTKALAKAKRDAEASAAADQVIAGVLVGTGLGLAAGAIFAAAKGVGKVVAEVGTEIMEVVVGKAFQPDPPDVFTPPPGLDPKLRAIPAGERLLDAWRGFGRFNFTTHAFGQYQLALEKLANRLETDPSEANAAELWRLLVKGGPGPLISALDTLHTSVLRFHDLARHPLLMWNALEIEQDLWIRWTAALPDDEDTRNAALDAEAVEDRMKLVGVLGDRLGIDYGRFTTSPDMRDAFEAATRERTQLDQMGRYGVAGEDIGTKPGRVALRDDLYERLGKQPPASPDPVHRSFPAIAWTDPVKSGQIVRVVGTNLRGLEVAPAKDANFREVFI